MIHIKMSDLIFAIAEAAVKVSKTPNKEVNIIKLYQAPAINDIALSAGYMRLALEKVLGEEVEIIKDIKKTG